MERWLSPSWTFMNLLLKAVQVTESLCIGSQLINEEFFKLTFTQNKYLLKNKQ